MPINRGKQYARTSSLATAPLWVALLFGIQLVSVGPIDDERPATVTHASGDFDWQSAPARYGDHAAVEGGWITFTSPHRPPLRSLADDAPAGCIAMHAHADDDCEMKRLYVRPSFRGHGLALRLCEALIAEARAAGYVRMLLDTLPSMPAAQALYERLGFEDIPAYLPDRLPGTRFMALRLRREVGDDRG